MKKLFAIILTLSLCVVMGFPCMASTITAEELEELKTYEIFTGDSEGNLRLEDDINRAEAVKMICTLLCLKPDPTSKCSFPDVAPGHWAEGWIELGKIAGIVSGDDEGNFRPYDSVTNEEYIKMLVTSLGYQPLAEQRGGFPAGYIAVANSNGLTKDMQFMVNVSAKRGDVALMTYRALDIPLMAQTGFGSQVEYQIMNGENGTDKRTLRLELHPDYVYSEKENKSEFDGIDFLESIYSYEDVEVTGLSQKDGTYTFKDEKKAESPVYTVDSSTYVYINKRTVPLVALKDGMYAKLLCAPEDDGTVRVLGIEIFEFNPNK
ncbi:MAG: S-layer homology domain-containing protein [Ruminococcaceae bacterium]|nr:S-layer homology domain-containing protein [Oscillospiraceae bacterium]